MTETGESYLEPVPSPRNSAAGDRNSAGKTSLGMSGAGGLAPHMHDYEELPGNARSRMSTVIKSPEFPHDNGLSGIVEKNSASGLHPYYGIHRKRINPLYESGDHEEELLVGQKQTSWGICECPCLGMILLTVISLIALLLSLFMAAGIIRPMYGEAGDAGVVISSGNISQQKLLEKLQQIESEYMQLKGKHEELQSQFWQVLKTHNGSVDSFSNWLLGVSDQVLSLRNYSQNTESNVRVISSEIEAQANQIQDIQGQAGQINNTLKTVVEDVRTQKKELMLVGELDSKVSNVESKLNSWKEQVINQLSTISKMPGPTGPQGPPGAGDMSKCVFNVTSRGTHAAASETTTDWFPVSQSDLNDWVVTGVSCSTEGGSSMTLGTRSYNGGAQFQCTCKGTHNSSITYRYCSMNMWRCPKNS